MLVSVQITIVSQNFCVWCSANVLKNPAHVFEADIADEDSQVSIESDEHFAVNKAALEFDENND